MPPGFSIRQSLAVRICSKKVFLPVDWPHLPLLSKRMYLSARRPKSFTASLGSTDIAALSAVVASELHRDVENRFCGTVNVVNPLATAI